MIADNSLQILYVKTSDLVPYVRNPRKNDAAVDRMVASIQEFGFTIPILARSDGEVIDGHLRLKAAQKLGMDDVPVIHCDGWTAAQVKAFRLLANRSASWAEWNEELLKLELADLNEFKFDLTLTGFDDRELQAFMQPWAQTSAEDETIPAVPKNPVTRPGDLWTLGQHRLICGDSRDPETIAQLCSPANGRNVVGGASGRQGRE